MLLIFVKLISLKTSLVKKDVCRQLFEIKLKDLQFETVNTHKPNQLLGLMRRSLSLENVYYIFLKSKYECTDCT